MQSIDFVILFSYLVIVASIAIWAGGKQTSARSFFLADKDLPWWMIMLSVVATETSVLTFLSIPGLAYRSDLGFLQLALGYIIGRWVVARYLLPHYFDQGIESTYEFIKGRWGPSVQRFTSLIFLITRILADGVRLFMTAVPLALITGWSYPFSILVIGMFTLLYTLIGGIKSVVWADSIQFVIYLFGAAATFWVIGTLVQGGWSTIFHDAAQAKKLTFIHLSSSNGSIPILSQPYHFVTAVIGGMSLSLASHGTDHLMVQRVLAARDRQSGQRALIGSGLVVFFQFAVFLLLGVGIWAFYGGAPADPNQVFSKFIIDELPSGLKGFIVAGIFSAAMSTLSSSINALASSTMTDWIKGTRPRKYTLGMSRALSVFWAVLLIGGASLFTSVRNPLVEIGLAIASFTYGGLLGFFVLGRLKRQFPPFVVILGFAVSLLTMTGVVAFTNISWPWYTIVGLSSMVLTSLAGKSFVKKAKL